MMANFSGRALRCTFVMAIKGVLRPIRDHAQSYVDGKAVYSDSFKDHLHHIDMIDCYLHEICWVYPGIEEIRVRKTQNKSRWACRRFG